MNPIRYVLLVFVIRLAANAQNYIWPTDASHYITSTFGESRSNHFHAGIDIKTWAQEGYRVFAIDSGWIEQVEIAFLGTGRSLLIHLADGRKVYFAHLSKFAPFIQKRIETEQKQTGRFCVKLQFEPWTLPVSRGQLVAYTGDTGAGPPHLHFEIWDDEGNPVNPFTVGYRIQDHIRPIIRALAITPLRHTAHVEGDFETKIFTPTQTGQGKYFLKKPIHVCGKIGFSISAFDKVDGVPHSLACYAFSLNIDGKEIFSSNYTHFPKSLFRQIALDRDERLHWNRKGQFKKLYNDQMIEIPFYHPSHWGAGILHCGEELFEKEKESKGPIPLTPGEHSFCIKVSDYFGNISELSGTFVVVPLGFLVNQNPIRFQGQGWTGGIPGKIGIPQPYFETKFFSDYLYFRFRFAKPLPEMPQCETLLNGWTKTDVALIPKSQQEFVGILPLDSSSNGIFSTTLSFSSEVGQQSISRDTVMVYYISPEYGGSMVSSDGICRVSFPPGSVYRPVWGTLRSRSCTLRAPGLGKEYWIDPPDIPLKETLTISFDVGAYTGENSKVSIYGIQGTQYPRLLESQWKNHVLQAQTTRLFRFTVLMDTMPPRVWGIQPLRNATLMKPPSRIQVRFADALSGIREESQYEIRLDEIPLLVDYNPERNLAICSVSEPLFPGKHVIKINVKDRVGNQTQIEQVFFILPK